MNRGDAESAQKQTCFRRQDAKSAKKTEPEEKLAHDQSDRQKTPAGSPHISATDSCLPSLAPWRLGGKRFLQAGAVTALGGASSIGRLMNAAPSASTMSAYHIQL